MTKGPVLDDLMDADWVATRYGRLFHIARDRKTTHCGRFAFENTDAPWCWWGGKACEVCVRAARSVKTLDKPASV